MMAPPGKLTSQHCRLYIPAFWLVLSQPQGECSQGTDKGKHLYLQTEARSYVWELGTRWLGSAQLPTSLLVASTLPSIEKGLFTEQFNRFFLTGEDPGILKIFN